MAMRRPDPSAIPPGPGVYLYRDGTGEVVYVGKARKLRRRVLSYFRTEGLAPKTRALMARAESVEFLATTTEKEAFLLEASLIKKHRPRYNILLRDDKQYALFRINLKAPFPRIEIVRRARKDGARYFGPFTSALAARETWKLLHKAFPLRRCADRAMKNRVRPCLYHHMGQCLAPCAGKVTEQDYLAQAEAAVRVLDGKSDALLKELETAMLEASDRLEFERAAALRDQMRAVRQTVERQAAVLPGGGDMDAVGLSPSDRGLALAVVFVRQGAVQGGRSYFWPGLAFEDASELLWSFLGQFYAEFMPPGRILLPWMPLDVEDAEDVGDVEDAVDAEAPEAGADADAPDRGAGADDRDGAKGLEAAGAMPEPAGASGGHEAAGSGESVPGRDGDAAVAAIASGEAEDMAGAAQAASQRGAGESRPSCGSARQGHEQGHEPDAAAPAGGCEGTLPEAGGLAREAMEQTLAERRGGPVRIVAPQNAQDNRLVDIATANAREAARLKERGGLDGVLAKIGQALGLAGPPSRIECVDVSHTGGTATRVGLVVWIDGLHQPDRSRAYALDGTGGDDFKALHAWVGRRIESGAPWPDLLLIDGGRGQIAAVARGLADQGQPALFPLAGIAKARDEEGHADRRAGNVADRIFLPGRSDAVAAFREGSPELLFLQNVRDSAHRFAISRHRRARGKAALEGELTRLPGIGPATARLLWDAFGSIEAMRRASLADLEKLPGIGQAKARGLHARLHGGEPEASPRQASQPVAGQAPEQRPEQRPGRVPERTSQSVSDNVSGSVPDGSVSGSASGSVSEGTTASAPKQGRRKSAAPAPAAGANAAPSAGGGAEFSAGTAHGRTAEHAAGKGASTAAGQGAASNAVTGAEPESDSEAGTKSGTNSDSKSGPSVCA